ASPSARPSPLPLRQGRQRQPRLPARAHPVTSEIPLIAYLTSMDRSRAETDTRCSDQGYIEERRNHVQTLQNRPTPGRPGTAPDRRNAPAGGRRGRAVVDASRDSVADRPWTAVDALLRDRRNAQRPDQGRALRAQQRATGLQAAAAHGPERLSHRPSTRIACHGSEALVLRPFARPGRP